MDGFEEDAAQHGTSLAALLAMLVDEGAELRHDSGQILLQLEVCWDLDRHLVSLHEHISEADKYNIVVWSCVIGHACQCRHWVSET